MNEQKVKVKQSPQSSIVSYRGVAPHFGDGLFLACGARLIGDCQIGQNLSVWFNAVVRGDVNSIRIGNDSNIQDAAVVHGTFQKYSTTIGNRVSIGHGAVIHGCTIEDEVLIGMRATIMDGAVIGKGSVVGAGAVVTSGEIIPPYSLVVGMPAKVKRTLGTEESRELTGAYKRYLEYVLGFSYPEKLVNAGSFAN